MRQLALAIVGLCMVSAACLAAAPPAATPSASPPAKSAAAAPEATPTPAVAPAPAAPPVSAAPEATAAAPAASDSTATSTAKPPVDIEPLLEKLKDRDPSARMAAATALGEASGAGNHDPRIVTALGLLLRDPGVDVKTAAVAALGATGDRRAATPLTGLSRQTDPKTRAAIARALLRLSPSPDDPVNHNVFTLLEKPMPDTGIDKKPLREALQALAGAAGVQLQITGPALEKIGLAPDAPVTLKAKDLPVSVALWEALWSVRRMHDVGAIVKEGRVIISTMADLEAQGAPKVADPVADEKALRERLQARVPKLGYDGPGLNEILFHMEGLLKTKFQVNWKALEDAGISRSDPLRMHTDGDLTIAVALQKILDAIPGKTKVGYVLRDGAIVISTKDDLSATAAGAATPTKAAPSP